MKTEFKNSVPLLLAIIGYFSWDLVRNCILSSTCFFHDSAISILPTIVAPISRFSLYQIIPFLVLIFVSKDVFSKWLKFSYWTVPIIVFILALMSKPDMGYGFGIITLDGTAQFLGILYAIATMIIIVRK